MSKDRPTLGARETAFVRSLSEFDITLVGVGAMIGAGIFVLIGVAAGEAGPAVMLVFVLNGVVTFLTAMAYAELGSALPEAGGAYRWVRDGMGHAYGFLAGWMSWFAQAVAGALYALGFGSFVVLMLELVELELPALPGLGPDKWMGALIVVAFVLINVRGASEAGLVGNVVTIGKLSVIGLFVAFGIAAMGSRPTISLDNFSPMFPNGFGAIFLAMGITFIAFEGYDIIAQSGEEVRDPRRSIPRATLRSLMIVVPVYVLVAVTVIGAVQPEGGQPTWRFLGEASELGLALAAERFMPFGTLVILIGGLLSTLSALNAVTFSSTRIAFALGRDRMLPAFFAAVHARFRTPYLALFVTGGLIVLMVLVVPLEDVAAAASVMFLLLFLQVNIAVLRIREEFGDRLDYGYRVPLYPWVPVTAIVANAGLALYLVRFSPTAWLLAGVWVVVGVASYALYGRMHVDAEERPRVTFEAKAGVRSGRTILAPVADPSHVDTVGRLAAAFARARGAEVVILNVVRIPPQLPMAEGRTYTDRAQPVIDAVDRLRGSLHDVQVSTVVSVGRTISDAINEIARREEAELIVLGWKGTVHEGRVRGSVAQEVLRSADRDVVVVKDHGLPDNVGELLAGASPGIRAGHTLELAADLARGLGADLRVLTVTRPGRPNVRQVDAWLDRVGAELVDGLPAERIRTVRVESDDVGRTFEEQARDSGLMLVGASRDWIVRRTLMGEFTDALANRVRPTLVMIRPREARPVSTWRRLAGLQRGGGTPS